MKGLSEKEVQIVSGGIGPGVAVLGAASIVGLAYAALEAYQALYHQPIPERKTYFCGVLPGSEIMRQSEERFKK